MYNLTAHEQAKAREYLELRFRDASRYEDAISMAYLELNYVSAEELANYDEDLLDIYERDEYIPESVLDYCAIEDALPVRVDFFNKVVKMVYAVNEQPEVTIPEYTVEWMKVPAFVFFRKYVRLHDKHRDLLIIPARTLLDRIFEEAIALKAADITISTNVNLGQVYYNVAKKYVPSNILFSKNDIQDMIRIICFQSPYDFTSRMPKDLGITINEQYRGRVNITTKLNGYCITIRLLPNAFFNKTFTDLNLKPKTVEFIEKYVLSEDFGLRLVVGATMSGKNTTILACLNSVLKTRQRKVVSVEMPVEQTLPGLEQINAENSEEYNQSVIALLRQNPDYVYITEMSEHTAEHAIRITNTGKIVISTLHANSCADTFSRLQDITGLSIDKLIQATNCVIYQELIRDEENDRAVPRNTMLYLDKARKQQLYGLPYGESLRLLTEWEESDE